MTLPARTFTGLGSDLALTRYVGTPSAVELDHADSWGGLDLAVGAGGRGSPRPSRGDDLETVSERPNLGQALIVRLLTPRGALTPLGHPEYGSRLVELVGRGNDETTRNLARRHVIEAVRDERRVGELVDLAVTTATGSPDTVRIELSVRPLADDEPLSLGLEVSL